MSALEQALDGPAIEVVAKATRRRFTVEYKRKIVREADGCKTPGAVGALLRREEVYASLLDAGQYLCSERMMYRLLAEHAEVRERRDQLRHAVYAAPELLARRPNELWSWDITKLLGPAKWTYFYLYVMLDVFSRYVVGWMVAHRESATLAERFIHETCARQEIRRDQLTIHADRGSAMTSKPIAFLL